MEKTNVVVPAGHAVAILATAPTLAYRVVDGIAVYLRQFEKRARVPPLDMEWELELESEGKVNYRLVDQRGFERVDPNPVEIPAELRATPSLRDQVVELVARYLGARAQDDGYETLEEANDFDIDGEVDDIATEAERSFLAVFKPHVGRAANNPDRPGRKSVENPPEGDLMPSEGAPGEQEETPTT